MKSLSNLQKMFICLVCAFAYGWIYCKFIKQPLLIFIINLPKMAHDFIVLISFIPFWILSACSVEYYLRNQKNNSTL